MPATLKKISVLLPPMLSTCTPIIDEKRSSFGCILSFSGNTIFPDKTEGILCQKIPVHRICTDPASTPTETPETAIRTPAPEPGLFFPEPCEHGISSVRPYPAEWLYHGYSLQKNARNGQTGTDTHSRVNQYLPRGFLHCTPR